jgi:hypothetical protein
LTVTVHAFVGGVAVVGGEMGVKVNVCGLGPVPPTMVTFAAFAPPTQLSVEVSIEPAGACVTVTCCGVGGTRLTGDTPLESVTTP